LGLGQRKTAGREPAGAGTRPDHAANWALTMPLMISIAMGSSSLSSSSSQYQWKLVTSPRFAFVITQWNDQIK
jgi:hypothetical protein